MPFDIEVPPSASRELVVTEGNNIELINEGSSQQPVCVAGSKAVGMKNPDSERDELVRNYGAPLGPKCLRVSQAIANMENL